MYPAVDRLERRKVLRSRPLRRPKIAVETVAARTVDLGRRKPCRFAVPASPPSAGGCRCATVERGLSPEERARRVRVSVAARGRVIRRPEFRAGRRGRRSGRGLSVGGRPHETAALGFNRTGRIKTGRLAVYYAYYFKPPRGSSGVTRVRGDQRTPRRCSRATAFLRRRSARPRDRAVSRTRNARECPSAARAERRRGDRSSDENRPRV